MVYCQLKDLRAERFARYVLIGFWTDKCRLILTTFPVFTVVMHAGMLPIRLDSQHSLWQFPFSKSKLVCLSTFNMRTVLS